MVGEGGKGAITASAHASIQWISAITGLKVLKEIGIGFDFYL
jgi:hypothetical protein